MKLLSGDSSGGECFKGVDRIGAMHFNLPTGIMSGPSSMPDLLKHSLLYREAQAEREEVMKHKWYESEKQGHDIGFDLAQVDWRIKYGSQWRKERQMKHSAPLPN
jgi:hypothetical protein